MTNRKPRISQTEQLREFQLKARQALTVLVVVDAVPYAYLPSVLPLLPEMDDEEKVAALDRAKKLFEARAAS